MPKDGSTVTVRTKYINGMRDTFETLYVFHRTEYYSQHRVDTVSFALSVLLISQIETPPPPSPPPPPELTAVTHRNSAEVKFTLEQTTKAQRGSRGIALLFLYPRG
jgi:hypothetical protein